MTNDYVCPCPQCPRRAPIVAESPPKCYTCGHPMAEVVEVNFLPVTTSITSAEVEKTIAELNRLIACACVLPTNTLKGLL